MKKELSIRSILNNLWSRKYPLTCDTFALLALQTSLLLRWPLSSLLTQLAFWLCILYLLCILAGLWLRNDSIPHSSAVLGLLVRVHPSSRSSHVLPAGVVLANEGLMKVISVSLSSSTCPYQFSVQISNFAQPGHENDKDARRLRFSYLHTFRMNCFTA